MRSLRTLCSTSTFGSGCSGKTRHSFVSWDTTFSSYSLSSNRSGETISTISSWLSSVTVQYFSSRSFSTNISFVSFLSVNSRSSVHSGDTSISIVS